MISMDWLIVGVIRFILLSDNVRLMVCRRRRHVAPDEPNRFAGVPLRIRAKNGTRRE